VPPPTVILRAVLFQIFRGSEDRIFFAHTQDRHATPMSWGLPQGQSGFDSRRNGTEPVCFLREILLGAVSCELLRLLNDSALPALLLPDLFRRIRARSQPLSRITHTHTHTRPRFRASTNSGGAST